MKIDRFEDIEGWQLARHLTREIYSVVKTGEFSKDFGLKDQITRAAGSVMHNIAEGTFTRDRQTKRIAIVFAKSVPCIRDEYPSLI
jgi:four helix bundle protein